MLSYVSLLCCMLYMYMCGCVYVETKADTMLGLNWPFFYLSFPSAEITGTYLTLSSILGLGGKGDWNWSQGFVHLPYH